MAKLLGTFRKTFTDISQEEAHKIVGQFEKSDFAPGFTGMWEITLRKEAPCGNRVNLSIYSRKKK